MPGCYTAITCKESDHSLSSRRQATTAYTSADVVQQFGNSGVSLKIRSPCCSLAIMRRQTDERD